MTTADFVFAIIGYLSGSIPFGLLLSRWAGLGDIRSIGSGNIGATNVLRTGNKKIAALTLLCDCLKGYLPVFAAGLYATPEAAIVAGLAALAGHLFPVWLKFKGGKGVATGLGVVFGWAWTYGLLFCAIWLLVFLVTRISSASALVATAVMTLASVIGLLTGGGPTWWPFVVVSGVVWFMHRANIGRLLKGQEPKSSFSKTT
jgi:acyl phosphate:glycerol-3-phosphate acyltransferase